MTSFSLPKGAYYRALGLSFFLSLALRSSSAIFSFLFSLAFFFASTFKLGVIAALLLPPHVRWRAASAHFLLRRAPPSAVLHRFAFSALLAGLPAAAALPSPPPRSLFASISFFLSPFACFVFSPSSPVPGWRSSAEPRAGAVSPSPSLSHFSSSPSSAAVLRPVFCVVPFSPTVALSFLRPARCLPGRVERSLNSIGLLCCCLARSLA